MFRAERAIAAASRIVVSSHRATSSSTLAPTRLRQLTCRPLGSALLPSVLPGRSRRFPARPPCTGTGLRHYSNLPSSTTMTSHTPASDAAPESQPRAFALPFVGAIDQGTTSTRFIVFDRAGAMVASHHEKFSSILPKEGWVEHDPHVLLDTANRCIAACLASMEALGFPKDSIKAVGVTNQRETLVVWDRSTGNPLCPAIVWNDTRTVGTVNRLTAGANDFLDTLSPAERDTANAAGVQATPRADSDFSRRNIFQRLCGLPLATYFSALKWRWLVDAEAEPGAKARPIADTRARGDLCVSTVDSWLIWNMTGRASFVTDVTNASRTMLMNLSTLKWDPLLCRFFDIDPACLPEIRSSAEVYGHFAKDHPLAGIPLSGCAGDQQAALVGHSCFADGDTKSTYGTGCFILSNTGERPVFSKHGLLTTVAYQMGPTAPPAYAIEGSVACAGVALDWLRDKMGVVNTTEEISTYAAEVDTTAGVHFVPAFSGLFAPYWRSDAQGIITGLTQFTDRRHLCRAALEAIAHQTCDVLDAIQMDRASAAGDSSAQPDTTLYVDGGVTHSDFLVQLQSDLAGVAVERPHMREVTALGAAYLAGVGAGLWPHATGPDADQASLLGSRQSFRPNIAPEKCQIMRQDWKQAIARSCGDQVARL
ncbi:glycerol kinase [Fonticula alba]|uniref:glycerol kinase n=1 Tax=Fonticula alba TaxID=691883 RepID=A0A058ZG85_FONAL|nr:glycerol kinase [Fonticula alba]KCV72467.1 glycerol kinase [Fonticula alba]|eukprot:XP_009492168.1 glycerol kinase [Fonticula alba]